MELILELLLILAAARMGGELAQRFGQPAVLGELGAGILLGPPILGWIEFHESLKILADLGIFFLMFLVGLKTNPMELKGLFKITLLTGLAGSIFPLGFGYLAALHYNYTVMQSLFVGIALSMTAIAVKSRILMDLGALKSRIGRIIVGTAIVDNLISLVLFAIIVNIATLGTLPSSFQIVEIIIKVVLFFSLALVLGYYLLPRMGPLMKKFRGTAIFFTFFILFAFMLAELAELLGIHFTIGAFIAGLFISEGVSGTKIFHKVESAFSSITMGFLAPIFFVWIAFPIDLSVLYTSFSLTMSLLIVAIISKLMGTSLGAYLGGCSKSESLVVGLGMNGRGAVELIIAEVGRQMGVLDNELFTILIFISFASSVFTSFGLKAGFSWFMKKTEKKKSTEELIQDYLKDCLVVSTSAKEFFTDVMGGKFENISVRAESVFSLKRKSDEKVRSLLKTPSSLVYEGGGPLRGIVHLKRAVDNLEVLSEELSMLEVVPPAPIRDCLEELCENSMKSFGAACSAFELFYNEPVKLNQILDEVGDLENRTDELYKILVSRLHKVKITRITFHILNELSESLEAIADCSENVVESLLISSEILIEKEDIDRFEIY